MREAIKIEQLKCQGSVANLARVLAPVKGVNDARVQLGHRRLLIDYEDEHRERLDAALDRGGFTVLDREPVEAFV